jgi:glutamate synthase domain-containing protein 3
MTGGTVVVLGEVGRNFAAGMTGGKAYVWDPTIAIKGKLAETAPEVRRLTDEEHDQLRELIMEHVERTDSPLGRSVLESLGDTWVVDPEIVDEVVDLSGLESLHQLG